MGCCISTPSNTEASKLKKHSRSDEEASSKLNGAFHNQNRAPPPSFEEESVKEVLSETPKPKPKPDPIFSNAELIQDLQQQQQEEEQVEETKINIAHKVEAFSKIPEKKKKQELSSINAANEEEIMSQVSEICSVSISISESVVSTMTNVTDKRDYDDGEQEVRQPLRQRSPAKPRNGFKRDHHRLVSQSPTRIPDQSPGKRFVNGSTRLVQGQVSGRLKGPGRKDPGESSGRRSNSPAAATRSSTAVMGRSPSAKRTNRSPGRVRSGPIDNSGTVEGSSSKWGIISNNDNRNHNDNCSTKEKESLENPLVSLECFIFL